MSQNHAAGLSPALLPAEAMGQRRGEGNARQPPLSQAAQAPPEQLVAPSILQPAAEQPCLCWGKGMPHEAGCEGEAELQALQKQAASSKAEQAESR